MSITDELREWFKDRIFMANGWQEIRDIADRIDVEHERELRETGEDIVRDVKREWVRLPLDVDNVPICVGDVLDGYGKTIEVVEMRHGRSGWVLISRDGNGYADTFAFTHHHKPTVEDVLREFAYGLGVPVADSYVAATAAKLRLAGDAE